MRIIVVSNLFAPEFIGGYELIAYELATRLTGNGHEVTVATSRLVNHIDEVVEVPFRIERCLSNIDLGYESMEPRRRTVRGSLVDFGNMAALRRLVADFAPDRILLCNIAGIGAYGIVLLLHHLGHRPVLYLLDNVFGGDSDSAVREQFQRVFNTSKALQDLRVVAGSSGVLREVQATIGFSFGETTFVPGWVPKDLPEAPSPGSAGRLRCVFASRVAPHKGTRIMLDAAQMLLERGETNYSIDVYSGGTVPEFLQLTHSRGLAEHIKYRGSVSRDEMLKMFANYDALLFPTWEREPLGLVAFEAAAQGCIPIITAQCGAAEWLIGEGDCIKIERDAAGLAGGIERLLYTRLDKRDAMRWRVRARVRSFFDADIWFPRIEAILRDVGEPKKLTPRESHNVQAALFTIYRLWET